MSVFGLSALLGAAIIVLLGVRAAFVLRAERGARRGSEPGTGHHVLVSEYFSGGGGGGQSCEYRVPRDPQEYARLFVPRQSNGMDGTK
ncbi:hypothetical protein LX81_01487 [Palleronia aestuarii]|uniref:Uncharacterized protein n=1 Tax=Palleronia aestuarii TaxID=568105 RepID=A0A2W7Q7K2_9RHOB|nr:hypothetical protein [Palleronia aestuarii]PZX17759.1 hypothetical protein LX81_01487 [Palleronia aestuarii]